MGREERKLRKLLERHETRKERVQKEKRKKLAIRQTSPDALEGCVIGCGNGLCRVRVGAQEYRVRSAGGAAPGDLVRFTPHGVREVMPRRTTLSRPDPANAGRELVLAANVDLVVHVVSAALPPLRSGLIDRFLIAIEKGGAAPLVCVNKLDLDPTGVWRQKLEPYTALDVPVVACSAVTGEGIADLRARLAGKVCVFTGHSGVGKSSLLNALCPGLDLRTGDVELKGRHTTSAASVHSLDGGATLIDTPGIRELGLWNVRADDLRRYFHEFEEHACRFRDCRHLNEPGCGVRAAAERGDTPQARYEAYVRILASLD